MCTSVPPTCLLKLLVRGRERKRKEEREEAEGGETQSECLGHS
jgi:hypothetical protein